MGDFKKAWTYVWFAPIYILVKITKIIFDDEFHKMVDKINTKNPKEVKKDG